MRVKTFEATSMQEALGVVKQEMGEEAFILSTRTKRRKTALGLAEESYIEVTAAVDDAVEAAVPGRPGQAPAAAQGVYGLRPPLAARAAAPAPAPQLPAPSRPA